MTCQIRFVLPGGTVTAFLLEKARRKLKIKDQFNFM